MEGANDDGENLEDMKFNGGLLIPGKIWHRLYKYVSSNVCFSVTLAWLP